MKLYKGKIMKNLNLKITNDEHHQLKTLSSYAGLSMKEFILSRVFADAAETVFTGKGQQKVSVNKMQSLQENYFEEPKIIVLPAEEWSNLRDKLSNK